VTQIYKTGKKFRGPSRLKTAAKRIKNSSDFGRRRSLLDRECDISAGVWNIPNATIRQSENSCITKRSLSQTRS